MSFNFPNMQSLLIFLKARPKVASSNHAWPVSSKSAYSSQNLDHGRSFKRKRLQADTFPIRNEKAESLDDQQPEKPTALSSPWKLPRCHQEAPAPISINSVAFQQNALPSRQSPDINFPLPQNAGQPQAVSAASLASNDGDWLRSRTTRLLGLADEMERKSDSSEPGITPDQVHPTQRSNPDVLLPLHEASGQESQRNAEPDGQNPSPKRNDANHAQMSTARLFLRNLAYSVHENDIQEMFAPFGRLREVCLLLCLAFNVFHDDILIGTTYPVM